MTLHSVLIQKLLSTNAHVGRRLATNHFKQFTYGNRNNLTIIDSDKTLICLRNALNFMGALVRQNGRFLFVNTNPLFDEIVEQMTKKIGCYNPNNNRLWKMNGFLTNSYSPKKFRSRNKRLCFGPTRAPDCIVIMDSERKSSVIYEAEKLKIPVVALVDSSMPWDVYKRVAYPIPGNDSVQFVYLLCNVITKTFLLEKKKMGGNVDQIEPEIEAREKAKGIADGKKVEKGTFFAFIELPIIPYEQLEPLSDDASEIKDHLDKLVVMKFNGDLGTNMGFDCPRSSIEVSNGMTVLDLLAKQIEFLNSKYGCNIPLLVMDSTATHDATMKALEKCWKSKIDVQAFELSDQLLSGVKSSGDVMSHSDQDALLSLMKGGTLDIMLSQGKKYILVVTLDNVGTVIDPKILSHLIQNNVECCMEVRPMVPTDAKGNNTITEEGKFKLGEIASKPDKHCSDKYKLISTRNLWANLKAVGRFIDTDSLEMEADDTKDVLEETKASSVIRCFDHPVGVCIPQSHYFPLNDTSSLLLLQSDLYEFRNGILIRNAARSNPIDPSIHLGIEFEKISDFTSRFKSIPSIIELDSLKVSGDVWFGSGITLKGNVSIVARPGTRIEIPDGLVLENKLINEPVDI